MRKKIYGIVAAVCVSSILAAGCGGKNPAETLPAQGGEPVVVSEESGNGEANEADGKGTQDAGAEDRAEKGADGEVAASDETVAQQSVGTEGMTPVSASELKDGVYPVKVDSSSSMLRVDRKRRWDDCRHEDGGYRLLKAFHGNRGRSRKGFGGSDDPI